MKAALLLFIALKPNLSRVFHERVKHNDQQKDILTYVYIITLVTGPAKSYQGCAVVVQKTELERDQRPVWRDVASQNPSLLVSLSAIFLGRSRPGG